MNLVGTIVFIPRQVDENTTMSDEVFKSMEGRVAPFDVANGAMVIWRKITKVEVSEHGASLTLGLPCDDHKPVQHRDAKPPWCGECELTSDFQTPKSRLRE